jgi:uncharacterized protein YcbK (DUF882 family)
MTYKFSKRSLEKLDTCHPDLIKLMMAAIDNSPIDFSIICGYRNKEAQNTAYRSGNSKVQYPFSKHNKMPSLAVDIQPYPYTEEDMADVKHKKFKKLNEHIRDIANKLEISVFNMGLAKGWDWYHWELVDWGF